MGAGWQPWVDFKDSPQGDIPVYGPPCPACKFWRPVVHRTERPAGSTFDGVQMCHSDDQEHDFSCFKERA
jgi:hypothetical protein